MCIYRLNKKGENYEVDIRMVTAINFFYFPVLFMDKWSLGYKQENSSMDCQQLSRQLF